MTWKLSTCNASCSAIDERGECAPGSRWCAGCCPVALQAIRDSGCLPIPKSKDFPITSPNAKSKSPHVRSDLIRYLFLTLSLGSSQTTFVGTCKRWRYMSCLRARWSSLPLLHLHGLAARDTSIRPSNAAEPSPLSYPPESLEQHNTKWREEFYTCI